MWRAVRRLHLFKILVNVIRARLQKRHTPVGERSMHAVPLRANPAAEISRPQAPRPVNLDYSGVLRPAP
eukprot:358139-Chlamydomonas_euryale.AAC.3